MADIPVDDKEHNEFDEMLNIQESLNAETAEKEMFLDVKSENENILEGTGLLSFTGNGAELFGIFMKNLLLNLLTIGIYYPWAKAKQLRYYYGVSRIHGSDFQFHGTGREMFIGLLKALVVLGILNFAYEGILSGILSDGLLLLTWLLYLLIFLLLILIASVGARRYRMSRTSWRGVRFRFRGSFKDIVILIAKGWLLSILSLGLYYPYYLNLFQDYWTSKTTFGNIAFSYDGQGKEVFRIWLKGILLSILSLGIFLFWLKADLQRYFWSHTSFGESRIISNLHGGMLFKETMIFALIMIITIGIGRAWAVVRYKSFYLGTFSMETKIDLAAVKQSEIKLSGATSEGMADFFDVEM